MSTSRAGRPSPRRRSSCPPILPTRTSPHVALRLHRLLVTGGAGFIGSAFVRQRLRADQEIHITVLDKLTYAGSEENLAEARDDPRLRFVRGDICDQETVERLAEDSDAIVNFA